MLTDSDFDELEWRLAKVEGEIADVIAEVARIRSAPDARLADLEWRLSLLEGAPEPAALLAARLETLARQVHEQAVRVHEQAERADRLAAQIQELLIQAQTAETVRSEAVRSGQMPPSAPQMPTETL